MEDVALRSEEEENEQRTRVDIFEEKCSSLYNLILDQLNDDVARSDYSLSLDEMAADVMEAAARITEECPEIEGGVQLRIHTISSAMEQLRLRRTTSDCESNVSRMAPFAEIRSWIHTMETRLAQLEVRYKACYDSQTVTKLLADQQILQLEIHNEGQSFFSRLDQLAGRPEGTTARRQNCIEGVRKRWHTLYINSLSLQCCIENRKTRLVEEEAADSDPELSAPPIKRSRRSSGFSETEEEDVEEYASSMDGRAPSSTSSLTRQRDWEHRDVGYSSGENSIHDTMGTPSPIMPSDQRRIGRVTVLPVKGVARKNIEDNGPVSPFKLADAQNLSDSLIVNESMTTSKEYDEVLALLDDTDSLHSGTNWREMRGRISPSVRRISKESAGDGKQSCDASSEESSSWEYDQEGLLSTSLHSQLAEDLFSLKRPRGSTGRMNVSMLSSEMDASFCSTRSENPLRSSRIRGLRKKIRPRRLPRSMSDGEHLGLCQSYNGGMETPRIHLSPPSTPLASSLSILRRLDDDLVGEESDLLLREERRKRYESGGEESANYEWDDYHPPSKDENWLPEELLRSINPMEKSSDMLSVDEDFSKELNRKSELRRLVEESRANLNIVQSHLSSCNIDADVMRTVTLIADTNIRHLQTALKNDRSQEDSSDELERVMDEWKGVVSPLPRLANQVRRFASSLRALSSSSALPSGGIQTKEEAVKALSELEKIRRKFEEERDQLRTLISTSAADVELAGMKGELSALSQGYEDAVDKMSALVGIVQKLNDDWEKWSSEQRWMREAMLTLEKRMESDGDTRGVVEQMEYCQERMNSLETMCNYLSSHLSSLQSEDETTQDSGKPASHFAAELHLYSSALEQLKKKVHDLLVIPPVPSAPVATKVEPKATVSKRRPKRTNSTQTAPAVVEEPAAVDTEIAPAAGLGARVVHVLQTSKFLQLLLLLSALCCLAALICGGVFKTTFGPHIEYVRGPPPV